MMPTNDIHGRAIFDHYEGKTKGPLMIDNTYGTPEEMPLEVFFRKEDEFSPLEQYAVGLCTGHVLDAGAGAGAISLHLQNLGLDVTAMENSKGCIAVMEQQGIKNIIENDVFSYEGSGYDTVLLLMNGIGLAGTINGLKTLLAGLLSMLNEGGQLIFDSSDVSYLKDDLEEDPKYFGELQYRYLYNGMDGEWFNWLYIDQETLLSVCTELGISCQIIFEDETGQYLVRVCDQGKL